MAKGKIELKVIIHPTPASLRFGDDGYFVTFAGTEEDQEQAAALILLKKTPLKITVEVDDEQVKNGNKNQSESERRWP